MKKQINKKIKTCRYNGKQKEEKKKKVIIMNKKKKILSKPHANRNKGKRNTPIRK